MVHDGLQWNSVTNRSSTLLLCGEQVYKKMSLVSWRALSEYWHAGVLANGPGCVVLYSVDKEFPLMRI